jgi:hypothetical protein
MTVSAADIKGVQLTRENLVEETNTARIMTAGKCAESHERKGKRRRREKEKRQAA